ncbi:SH3BGR domain containing protein [Trichuris trichiura]|uniref:SH3BGR domain containing protein n=1 Tax=Trichuris trichiura TaxID=36087 RepID=A0A077YXC0_TRITR|nr:SH3BGR domain containing protein [Trichuris trichiura]
MASSVVRVVVSSVTPSLEAKKKTQWALMVLDGASVPYETVDLCDPSKRDSAEVQMWKEKSSLKPGKYPQFFSEGIYLGDVEDFENAVESCSIRDFLKLPELTHSSAEHEVESSDALGIMTEPYSTTGSYLISSADDEISNSITEEGSAKDQLVNEKLDESKVIVERGKVNEDGSMEGQESVDEVSDVEEEGNEEDKESTEEQTSVHDEGDSAKKESIQEQESVVSEEEVKDLSDVEPTESVAKGDEDDKRAGLPENLNLGSENGLPPSKEGHTTFNDVEGDSLEEANVSLTNSNNVSAVRD